MSLYICKSCTRGLAADQFRIHKDGYRIGKCRQCEREYQRAWYASEGERARKIKRDYMARRRAENPEAAREKQRAYYSAPDKRDRRRSLRRDWHARRFFWRRATKMPGIHARQLAALWKAQRGLCALTGQKLDRSAELDHIIPRARGGSDAIDNLRWVCASVNRMKRDLTDDEFIAACRSVVRWIAERIAANMPSEARP